MFKNLKIKLLLKNMATRLTPDSLIISKLQTPYNSSYYDNYGLWTVRLWTGSQKHSRYTLLHFTFIILHFTLQ